MSKANLGDLMIDLETLGNSSNAVIVSIGAVEFNMETGETDRRFYTTIDIQSSLDHGLEVNGSTIYWWLQQDGEARSAIIAGEGQVKLEHALHLFTKFMDDLGAIRVWGNSNRFDLGILHDSYKAIGKNHPWIFRLERDVRTLSAFKPEIKKKWEQDFKGVRHHPIDDCLFQIGYCHETLKAINNYPYDVKLPIEGKIYQDEK